MPCRPITALLSSLRMVTLAAVAAVASLSLSAVVTSQEAYADQAPPGPKADVDLDVLIDAVSDFGRWQQHDDFGIVWVPNVDKSWRPYTLGQTSRISGITPAALSILTINLKKMGYL